jgi:preprotein translocase subunit SecA
VLARCQEIVGRVGGLEPAAQACTDGELRARTGQYRERLSRGETDQAVLPEAFATVREAASRAIGLRLHDVQIMGGAVLQLGLIAEMRTGEGKTLTATLPAYLAALSGQPVHIMTANDYLTARDRDWMRPVYQFLGLSAGLLIPAAQPDPAARRAEYAADVVYGQWDGFATDFIRDNLAWDRSELVQRGLGFVLVDEADLILVDQMRTSALVTGPAPQADKRHEWVAGVVGTLRSGTHFSSERATMTASLTDAGISAVEDQVGIDNLFDPAHGGLANLVQNAVSARALFERDRDYLVSGDQIVLIDRLSGRPLASRYGDGIHEALEAKEGLPVQAARMAIGSVVCRDYLRQYERLAGMTGTAASEAPIYRDLYGLDVITIPTNSPVIRVDHPDKLYRTRSAKLAAIAADAGKRVASGRPVLVGAMSEADADAVAGLLHDAGIPCELLSARNFEREAAVLAEAGRPGAVTIVVKMAGRGVDIVLGGSSGAERDAVADSGGLCVLGTERNGDRRTELHLRGRAGRQGDPGESLFYLSAEDEIVARLLRAAPKGLLPDGAPFGRLSRELDKAQLNVAASQAQWYLTHVAFDDVLAQQQRAVYADRRTLLQEPDADIKIVALLDGVLGEEVAEGIRAGRDAAGLLADLSKVYPPGLQAPDLAALMRGGRNAVPAVTAAVRADAGRAYRKREAELSPEVMRELARRLLLSKTDRAWRGHLAAMSDLMSSALIRAAGGVASLPDYQRAAAALYTEMMRQIPRRAVADLFYLKNDLGHGEG